MLRRALSALTATLAAGGTPSPRMLKRLVQSWSNESWSTDEQFLATMLHWVGRTSGSVVECGSGLSTLVLAAAVAPRERRVLSLEHNTDWAKRVRTALSPGLAPFATVGDAPLKSYGPFDWYSAGPLTGIPQVGLIVCDGPPGATRGGRYGAAPVLRKHMAPGCVLLMDDSHRPDERSIMHRWCDELPATIVESGETYSVLQLVRPDPQ